MSEDAEVIDYEQGRERSYEDDREKVYEHGREKVYEQGEEKVYDDGPKKVYEDGQMHVFTKKSYKRPREERENPYRRDSFRQDSFKHEPYRQKSFRQDKYGSKPIHPLRSRKDGSYTWNCLQGCGYFMKLETKLLIDDKGDGVCVDMTLPTVNMTITSGHTPAPRGMLKEYMVMRCINKHGCGKLVRAEMTQDGPRIAVKFTDV